MKLGWALGLWTMQYQERLSVLKGYPIIPLFGTRLDVHLTFSDSFEICLLMLVFLLRGSVQ